jgi:hypothetical protein
MTETGMMAEVVILWLGFGGAAISALIGWCEASIAADQRDCYKRRLDETGRERDALAAELASVRGGLYELLGRDGDDGSDDEIDGE